MSDDVKPYSIKELELVEQEMRDEYGFLRQEMPERDERLLATAWAFHTGGIVATRSGQRAPNPPSVSEAKKP